MSEAVQPDTAGQLHTAAAHYRQLDSVRHVQPLSGHSGYVQWLLTTSTQRFVLRTFPPNTSLRRAQLVAAAQQCVARAGLAPPVIPDRCGQPVAETDDGIRMLTGYAEGSCGLHPFPDPQQCRDLGGLLGQVHHALRAVAHVPTDVADPLRPGSVGALDAALAVHNHPGCRHPAARRALRAKLELARALTGEQLDQPVRSPVQLVHGDIHPGNLVTVGGQVRAFVDFERVRLAPAGYELVRALLYCVSPAGPRAVSTPRVEAFLGAYLHAAPLDKEQLDNMVTLYRTVQVLDPHGLDRCEDAEPWRLRFGHARFALLCWLDRNGIWLTDLAVRTRRSGFRRQH